jgi:hypothetical protein
MSSRTRLDTRVLLALALTLACGDGILHPASVVGYYHLVSVNGAPLPYPIPPSLGFSQGIGRGDLVLRGDGSFMQVAGPVTGDGTYRATGRELRFNLRTPDGGRSEIVGRLSGDSLSVDYSALAPQPLQLIFRRGDISPAAFPIDRLRLTSVNGSTSAPFVLYDTVIGGTRYTKRVLFDSLTLLDGVFFRSHRGEQVRVDLLDGDSLIVEDDGETWGAVESTTSWLHLYFGAVVSPRDSLEIRGDTLVRRRPFIIGLTQTHQIVGITEERYTGR